MLVCRICFDTKHQKRVKFHSNSEWTRLFEYCVGLQIPDGDMDTAPLEFCGTCANTLQKFSNFKRRCHKSDYMWKSGACRLKYKDREQKNDFENQYIIEPEIEDWSGDAHNSEEISQNYIKNTERNVEILSENIKKENILIKNEDVETKQLLECDINYLEVTIKKEDITIINDHEQKPKACIRKKIPKNSRNRKPKRSFICPNINNCGKCYAHKGHLERHILSCVGKNSLQETTHVEKTTKPSIYYCGICEFSSPEFVSVRNHFNAHCLENNLECKLCSFVGRDLADMVYHRYEHFPRDEEHKCICPHCCMETKVRLKLQYHYRLVHLNKIGGLCSICNKTMKSYKGFRNHEKSHKVANYICDHCGLKFLFRSSIVQHLADVKNVKNNICDYCGKTFNRLRNLKSHIYNIHTETTRVLCTHCNRMFKSQSNLDKHLEMLDMEKPFMCDVCRKSHVTKKQLRAHMFFHTGLRPFSCELCGCRYKAKCSLKLHMMKHTGLEPHKCPHCDKGFTTAVLLRRHQSVHTGIRKIKCLYCDRTFNAKSQMYAHCNSKHKELMQ